MADTQPAAENNTMGRRVQGCRNNCQAVRIGCGEHGVSPDSCYKRQRHISTMATTAVPHFVRLHKGQVPRLLLLFISAGQLNVKQRGLTVLGDGQLTVLLKGRFLRIIAHSIVSVGRPDSRYHDSRHSCAVAGVRTANDSHRLLCSGGIRLAWQMMAQRVGEHQIAVLPRENRQM